jgi:autotransporter-associated beta strand protein
VSGNISGATNGITVYGNVNVSGNISVDTNGITAYGPVNLSGTNTYTGNTAVFAGNLTVSGGTINAPNSTITVGNGATGVSFDVTGGTVTANALNVAPVGGSTGDNASITGSGSAVFTNVNLGSGGNTSGPFTINTTGSVALGALIDYKDLSGNGPSTTSGLIIDNGSVTASSVIIQDTGSGANMNINGGSLTIGNSASTGAFEIGNGGSTRGGWLIMSGGSLTYLGTDGLLMLLNSGSEGSANISGATSIATLTGLTLNKINVAGASSWLTLSGGATLYLGKVGLVINQPSATAYASLGTATVGAITNWSSTAPITLTGTVIFQAADASGVAHNISLGGPLSGAGGLIKTGAGMLTLSGTNTYSGGITVSNGTLLANSMAGSATGPGSVTVAGGTLGGIGIISGAVTVNSGGMLAPGNPLGVLTVSNTLTLAAGSTTFMQVQHSPLTNNNTKVSSTLTEGGTLNVTNISATPLSNGDNFKLFNAGSYSGAFAAYVLPPLGPNLAWKTSTLNSNGVISVVPLTSPSIIGASIDVNGNLVCSGTGAPADWSYRVLTSTNVTLPLAQWTSIATNQTDAGGNFFATNRVGTNVLQSFLILQFQ